jgi:DNA repair protein RadD
MIQLRDFQQEAVNAVYSHLRERDDNPCVSIATGGGKSYIVGQIAADATRLWNGRVLILAHVKELLEQNAEKLRKLCPEIDLGIYSAGLKKRDIKNAVIIAGIQSIYKRACELGRFDIAIVDECHTISHEGDGMYRTFFNDAHVINPSLRIVGLTATPYRMKGGLICKPENILNHICYEANIKQMIVDGYLCPLITRGGKIKANLNDLHIRGGEFIASEIEEAMDKAALVHAACDEIVDLTRDRKAVLIFTSGIKHCEHVAAEIKGISGEECGIVTGNTPPGERAELLARFRGETVRNGLFDIKPPIKYLANVNVLTTGFDAPNIDCVAIMRPTMSPGLLSQMVGRGFRLHPGKKNTLILDYGENIIRHGPIDAIRIREPSTKNNGLPPAKECPECHALIATGYTACPECGHIFPKPEEVSHEAKASDAGILTGQVTIAEYPVQDVLYRIHTKQNASEDTPKTMRVEYQIGWQRYKSEWICFEHKGWSRLKAESWWKQRTNAPIPDTASDAVNMARSGALCETKSITVRSITGDKYDSIIGYDLGEKPFYREPGWDDGDDELKSTAMVSASTDDDVPF